MRKSLLFLLFLVPASLTWLSCGSSGGSSTAGTSGVQYRALLTNSVSAGTAAAGIYVVNAATDVRPFVPPIQVGSSPRMMVVTPNRAATLVFSSDGTPEADNLFSIVNNASEHTSGQLSLPGMTESFVVSPDSSTAYIALPTATVIGGPPGLVVAISLSNGGVIGQVFVPSVHYLSISNSGNRIFGFSDNSDSVAVITPSQIGIGNALSYIGGFSRPVQAFFSSDDSTAYVVNCGAQCGGLQASVQQVNVTTSALGPNLPVCYQEPSGQVCAGIFGMVDGSTLYLAGTPPYVAGVPQQACTGQATASPSCGLLSIINLTTLSLINTAPIVITDGYHNQMTLGANGQLFIGAHGCTEISPGPPPAVGEVRGCLSIYNTLTTTVGSVAAGGVLIPPANGDVTGLQPIGKRGQNMAQKVVYVVQDGSVNIYDVTIDALEYNPNNYKNPGLIGNLVGVFWDVKTVDF